MRKLLKFNNNYTINVLYVGNLYEYIYVVYVRIFIWVNASVSVWLCKFNRAGIYICISMRMYINMYSYTYMYSLLKDKV